MKMKKSLKVVFLTACLAVMVSGCDSVQNIFSRDLNLKMMVENADGLNENSLVYLVREEHEARIGAVRKIKSAKGGTSIVYLSIDRIFKDKIREGTLFMVNRSLLSVDPPSILVDTLPKDSGNPRLGSGSIVYETSYQKYNLMVASAVMKDVYDAFMQQSTQFVRKLEEYIHSDEFDQFISLLDQLSNDISTFTKEQKDRFENEILPQLEEKMEEAMKNFTGDGQEKEREEQLRKEMNQIKNQLQV